MAVTSNLTDKISDYSITAEMPSLDPSNMSGSTGSLSLTTVPVEDYPFFRNREFTITDTRFGSSTGRVSSIDNDSGSLKLGGESTLRRLNATVTVLPQRNVSLSAGMQNVLSLAGFSVSGLPVTPTTYLFPGWRGTLLDYLKHFCAVYKWEYLVNPSIPDQITFRNIRSTPFSASGVVSLGDHLDDQTLAKSVEVIVREYLPDQPVFEFTPAAAESEPQILTVDPGETVEYEIKVNGWVRYIYQPQVMDFVGPDDTNAYCVAGSDGLPVKASQWTDFGGKLSVEITEDPSVIKVTLVGPNKSPLKAPDDNTDRFGPYSIAATAVQDNAFYNSLHIAGQGVRFVPSTISCPTGSVSDVTIEEVGTTVDNPFVSSLSIAYDVGVSASQSYTGPTHSIDVSLVPTGNQIHNTLGSRFKEGFNNFRVESVTISDSGVTASGNSDDTMLEHDALWDTRTMSDYDTMWDSKTLTEQSAIPLWEN